MFHDATVPPDDFIANCKLSLAELIEAAGQPLHEIWLELEPKVGTCRLQGLQSLGEDDIDPTVAGEAAHQDRAAVGHQG